MPKQEAKRAERSAAPALVVLAPLWLELVFRGAFFGGMFCAEWTYLLPLSLAAGGVLALLSLSWPHPRAAAAALCALLGAFFAAVSVYTEIFGVLPALWSIRGAGQAMQFWRETLAPARRLWPWLVLDFAPAAALCALPSGRVRRLSPRGWGKMLAAALLSYLAALGLILCADGGAYSPRKLYFELYLPQRSARLFGVVASYTLDARALLRTAAAAPAEAAVPAPLEAPAPQPEPAREEKSVPVSFALNTMAFDFEAYAAAEKNGTVASLHRWFAAQEPTAQNEYTGLFRGKNLILITAEGWSPYAVREDLTPTLWRMLHEGFVFENYYVPVWGVSTTDGEYAACLGLLPKTGVWSFYWSSANWLPLCMGNQLSALGYTARAYHDNFYDYYGRDVSHPNMGYVYKGYGNGLNLRYTWPESDREMIELTADEFIGAPPFVVYYMTVSGHLAYSFSGNYQSSAHRDAVRELPLSEEAQAYLACNYELELAMEELLARLEAAGLAEDTVICITPDHYPYGLSRETYAELAGGDAPDPVFERYRSCLALWSPSMREPVAVEKPVAQVDILPTLSNLFGLSYDSRLLMGRDALAAGEGLVIFADRSWITDRGRYNANTDTFTPAQGAELPEDYVRQVSRLVDARAAASGAVLDTDYYAALWDAAGLARRPAVLTRAQMLAGAAPKETNGP